MSGHSHFANVKRKKEKSAQARSSAFTRASKQIMVAVREGGPNPETNYALKIALGFAKSINMPKDSIERVIKKASGQLTKGDLKQIIYEAYGPEMFPMLIEVVTDNVNRTLNELRRLLSDAGGKLADKGSIAWQFTEVGLVRVSLKKVTDTVQKHGKTEEFVQPVDFDECMMELLDLGDIQDIVHVDNECLVFTEKPKISDLVKKIGKLGYKVTYAGRFFLINENKPIDHTLQERLKNLLVKLEDITEIQNTWSALDLQNMQ